MLLRTSYQTHLACCIALVHMVGLPLANVRAQTNPNGNVANAGGAMTVQIQGTLTATNGKILQVKQADGNDIYVQLPTAPNAMQYEAELTPQQIQRGMSARFTSSVDAMTNGPIVGKNVELFATEEAKNYNAKDPSVMIRYISGIYPSSVLSGNPESTAVYVVGQVVGLKDNSLIINAGQPINVQMPVDSKFKFKTMSMQFAKIGDQVVGNGITYNPQSRQVVASNLTVVGKIAEPSETAAAKERIDGR